MGTTIIVEYVEAKFDEERLLLPASASFTLRTRAQSVITVVAKTHYYWAAQAMTAASMAR